MSNGCQIAMVGLGVMGRNLLLNMVDHGIAAAGYDRDSAKVEAVRQEPQGRDVGLATSVGQLVALLQRPRNIMMMVPAGPPVDSVIESFLPALSAGDLIIDGGNSHFTDTDARINRLKEKGIHFIGVGISGGGAGARHGPSIMVGGPEEVYQRVQPIFEAIAAEAVGLPCVAHLGNGSAGHYVKMVHNGIEYGLMQLIAESYDLMRRGLNLDDDAMHDVYAEWNAGELQGYLMEITADIFQQVDERTGRRVVDVILDEAAQKGTGLWACQDALELQMPTPTIDTAVNMRDLSGLKDLREEHARVLNGPSTVYRGRGGHLIGHIAGGLYASMIVTYSQGMALLRRASEAYDYGLKLRQVVQVWRGGCIIRSRMLDLFDLAYERRADLPSLLLDADVARQVMSRQADLRAVAATAAELGIPAGAFMASLSYMDGIRSRWLPANLIQAQRDFFGAHTYQRVDVPGSFHTEWSEEGT